MNRKRPLIKFLFFIVVVITFLQTFLFCNILMGNEGGGLEFFEGYASRECRGNLKKTYLLFSSCTKTFCLTLKSGSHEMLNVFLCK